MSSEIFTAATPAQDVSSKTSSKLDSGTLRNSRGCRADGGDDDEMMTGPSALSRARAPPST
eukprot:94546-Pyramimonas_sp.AAC.1